MKAVAASRPPRAEGGFTLLELIVAMAVFALVGLGVFGVLVLGGRSAGSGERVTEQARRYRIASEVITRQLAATEPIQLPVHEEGDGELGGDSGPQHTEGFFVGRPDLVEFVTTAPQRPDASGMAIVRYWVEDGTLRMAERPLFSAYGTGADAEAQAAADSISTVLLYDVGEFSLRYLRESDSDEWLEEWDPTEEGKLPAVVRMEVRPSAVGGPDFVHEIPVMVGSLNQVASVDEDFPERRIRAGGAAARSAAKAAKEAAPPDTQPDAGEEDDSVE